MNITLSISLRFRKYKTVLEILPHFGTCLTFLSHTTGESRTAALARILNALDSTSRTDLMFVLSFLYKATQTEQGISPRTVALVGHRFALIFKGVWSETVLSSHDQPDPAAPNEI